MALTPAFSGNTAASSNMNKDVPANPNRRIIWIKALCPYCKSNKKEEWIAFDKTWVEDALNQCTKCTRKYKVFRENGNILTTVEIIKSPNPMIDMGKEYHVG